MVGPEVRHDGTDNIHKFDKIRGSKIQADDLFATQARIGDLTTGIKMKKLTGTTGATENDETNIAHGLTTANIISMTCLVSNGANIWLQPEHIDTAELQYSCMVSSANVIIKLHPTNSGSILNENIIVLITYEG